jgi:hypothetical protein|tara:strand:- start:14 stop:334 length:321 start_codon:yes stop_codon:yes gene_type:complete
MGLTLKIRSLKSIGDEIGVSEEEVKGICKNLNLPIERRGTIEMVDVKMFEKHFNSGNKRRVLSPQHLEEMSKGKDRRTLSLKKDRTKEEDKRLEELNKYFDSKKKD